MTTFKRRTVIRGAGGLVGIGLLAGCLGDDDDDDVPADDDDDEDGDPEDRATSYLDENDANLFDGSVEDQTGESEVTILVGGGDRGLAFDPPAVRVDTGTTIVWEWTGEGGGHNVVPDGDTDFDDFGDSEVVADAGHTVEYAFDEAGVGLYVCQPHRAQGMFGAVVVE